MLDDKATGTTTKTRPTYTREDYQCLSETSPGYFQISQHPPAEAPQMSVEVVKYLIVQLVNQTKEIDL